MARLSLSDVEVDPNSFEPRKFILVGGVKTECSINIESIQDSLALHGLDIKDELPPIIAEELKQYNVTTEEVVELLNF